MFSRPRIGAATLVAAAVASMGLTGCTTHACVSWTAYDSVEQAFEDAEAVVVGELRETGKTERVYGVQASVHEMDVQRVVKGNVEMGEMIRIASTPITCSGNEVYPDGDPLATQLESVVFLTSDEAKAWRTLSPFESVHPVATFPELG